MGMDSDLNEFITEASAIRQNGPRTPLENQVVAGLYEIERLRAIETAAGELYHRHMMVEGGIVPPEAFRPLEAALFDASNPLPTKGNPPTEPCPHCTEKVIKIISVPDGLAVHCRECGRKLEVTEKRSG